MKLFKNILEDKDYIKSEEQKFVERDCNISIEKRKEMREYYDAYKRVKENLEDGEFEFMGTPQETINKLQAQVKEIKDSGLEFALRRMSDIIAIDELTIFDDIYAMQHSKGNTYYVCKDLVHHINTFFDITGEKEAHRIAWGWNKFRETDNPNGYLYGCIRNYLKRNNKFDKKQFNRIWFGNFR